MAKKPATKTVETLKHDEDKRKNIPTAEYQSVLEKEQQDPKKVRYPRNTDLDPQLVWRGKDQQDWSDLVVPAPPLYIQEKVHPKALIDDLLRQTKEREHDAGQTTADLFADFNGIPKGVDKTEFYQHDQNWSNRMILGDSLQVMASLAEREGLRGKVQCIYFDPPYGIKFNSNFQWSTTDKAGTSTDATEKISREPEQVKAFRDTWRDGVHSYLTYIRDRFTVARDLLTESGSIFVQIGTENVHRVRALLDEVFGESCLICEILAKKKGAQKSTLIDPVNDYILWYSKSPREGGNVKFRPLFEERLLDYETVDYFSKIELIDGRIINLKNSSEVGSDIDYRLFPKLLERDFPGGRLLRQWPITNGGYRENQMHPVNFHGRDFSPPKNRCWSHTSRPIPGALNGMERVRAANRLMASGISLDFKRYYEDFPFKNIANWWDGFRGALDQIYVVQTNDRLIERCILMATDPGDLVLDPTCGSGTTAYVSEQWGRRWITIDTSRVALALARARVMGARYPFYLLADSREGQAKESELKGVPPSSHPTHGNIHHGFVYRRCPYFTSGIIANNAEIDVIWDKWQAKLGPLRATLNRVLGKSWEEWEIPRDISDIIGEEGGFQKVVLQITPSEARRIHSDWWEARMARQKEMDASIAAKAESEYLYDKPYEDKRKVRVAGPFTVESLSPHRVLGVDQNDDLIDGLEEGGAEYGAKKTFPQMILENLKTAGVQQAHKEDKIIFTALTPWPGDLVCAQGSYMEGEKEKRAGIFIGPEFGTVQRADLVAAAREAGDAAFDVLIACAFNYEAHATEFTKLGRIPVLKARMNADLHMAEDLKNTGKGNLFVIFGEPDIDLLKESDGRLRIKIKGVDVFKPQTGEVVSDGADGIACWFIDTDYNEESFFVRHAYFLGANDPYNALRTTLKAEIDPEAWATLNSDTSRPFDIPKNGRIAVKVINHLGDEVMKVFKVT